jgi:uncharacterized protein (TIGR00730 family)
MEEAYATGKKIAEKGMTLVYGGASVGCMGAVAQGALDQGGEVIGVLPHFLNQREIAHRNLQELIMVDSMHERKLRMNELSDGSISLPGGFGTLEEFFEIITWGQLGLHQKPSALLNVNAYYNHLIAQLDHMAREGLLQQSHRDMLLIESDIDLLLNKMEKYQHPKVGIQLKEKES